MSNHWLDLAVQNNMDWYEAEAQAWNIEAHRTAHAWWSTQPVPAYHSNLVAAGTLPASTIAAIDAAIIGAWSIKDAHAKYDLQPLGFEVLFDATWIARPPEPAPLHSSDSPVTRVEDAATLSRWIDAWDETPPGQTVFQPALLANPNVHFVYVEGPQGILGGLCLNESPHTVGITNTFGSAQTLDLCIAYAAQSFPGKALVGYERGDDLEQMLQRGFVALGELRVWISNVSR